MPKEVRRPNSEMNQSDMTGCWRAPAFGVHASACPPEFQDERAIKGIFGPRFSAFFRFSVFGFRVYTVFTVAVTCHPPEQNRPMPAGFATGKSFMRDQPREATCPSTCPPKSRNVVRRRKPRRSWKPFTRMAKWEIRFQRFALSFRLSALGHGCFRFPLAFSLQPLAFATGANEKFHLSRYS
jgi:hypothetical protein